MASYYRNFRRHNHLSFVELLLLKQLKTDLQNNNVVAWGQTNRIVSIFFALNLKKTGTDFKTKK